MKNKVIVFQNENNLIIFVLRLVFENGFLIYKKEVIMPRFDRTGPEGKGAQTGRGMGKCNSGNQKNKDLSDEADLKNRPGRGAAQGKGGSRGLGRLFGGRKS